MQMLAIDWWRKMVEADLFETARGFSKVQLAIRFRMAMTTPGAKIQVSYTSLALDLVIHKPDMLSVTDTQVRLVFSFIVIMSWEPKIPKLFYSLFQMNIVLMPIFAIPLGDMLDYFDYLVVIEVGAVS